jgi:hypothetical protein
VNERRLATSVCPGIRRGARCRYRLNPADRFGICWQCWQALPDVTARALQAGGSDARLQLQQHLAARTPLEQIEVT